MKIDKISSGNWERNMKRSAWILMLWTASWTFSIALITFGPRFLWNFNLSLTILAVLINAIVGIGMIRANILHLRAMDEMQQKLFYEASAVTVGVALVFGGSFQVWQDIQLITFTPNISLLFFVMAFTFILKTALGVWRMQ